MLAAAAADESGAALRAVCEQLRSAEKGGGDHSGRDPAQPGLLDFCYSRISVVYSAPIRHVASECVGLLSAARLKPVVEMFLASLARVTSDRDEREFVPSMRATRLLQLSTHSAEQAAASLAYLKALASSMARVSRGVLRAEVCAALVEALPRLMAPADDDRRGEWAEYCSGSAAREWWRAYAEVYSHMLRWARGKGAHAPFCYEAMVPMLALASRPDAGDGGDAFADKARREQLLLLLAAALKRDARPRCLPLAATFVASLPVAFLRADLGSGARESPIRRLCQEVLPRRHLPDASEGEHVLRLLLALAAAQPDAAYALQLVRDSLHPGSPATRPQRALLLQLLAQIGETQPAALADAAVRDALRALVIPLLHPPDDDPAHRPTLAAALACLPNVWASGPVGERDVLELQRVAQLVESDVRELHHAACICLNSLASADGLHLALPALAALCRALLRCDGSHGPRLQRALSASVFLVKNATDALAAAVAEAGAGDAGGGPTAAAWHALRVHMEAASLAWLQHATPEVVTQAAALLAAFDSPKLRALLPPPPPERSLVAALPDGWGVETNTARAREAQGWAWAAEAEAALRDDFSSFFPPTALAWAQLWRQARRGPRTQQEHASAAEGIALWRRQLRYLVLHAREPIAAWFPDPSANNAVNHDDVEALFRSLLRWLLDPAPPIADAAAEALRLAHDSTLALIVKELKLLAIERGEAAQPSRAFSLFAPKPVETDTIPELYFNERILLVLSQLYAKIPPDELAAHDGSPGGMGGGRGGGGGGGTMRLGGGGGGSPGPARHRLLATTLEELCSVWLRDQKPLERKAALAALPDASLRPAAHLLRAYFLYIAADDRRRNGVAAAPAGASPPRGRPLARSANTPPVGTIREGIRESAAEGDETSSSAVTTTATTSRPPARQRLGTDPGITNDKFIRRGLALLRAWMAAAMGQMPPLALATRTDYADGVLGEGAPPIISAPRPESPPLGATAGPDLTSPDTDGTVASTPASGERGGGGGSDTSTAGESLVDQWEGGAAGGVGTAEAVLLAAEALMGVRPLDDGAMEGEVLTLLQSCLSTPPLQRAACRALAAFLRHNGRRLPAFLKASLRGAHATQRAESTAGSEEGRRPSATSIPEAAPAAAEAGGTVRFAAPEPRGRPANRTVKLSLGSLPLQNEGLLSANVRHLGGGGFEAEATLAHAHFHAVVARCGEEAAAVCAAAGEARLLFLALLYQVAPHAGSRELGLALAATLAHAESVAIRPDDDLLLPITSAPQPQLYRAATFRYSASLAPRNARLLAGLLQQLIDHWALLELEEREVLLEMMLPWLRLHGASIGADDDGDGGDGGETERMDDGRQRQTGSTPRGRTDEVLECLLALCRLAAADAPREGMPSESNHLSFLLETAWAALVTRASAPLLVPATLRLLLRAHVAAASLDDDHMRPEKALCGRVLLVLSRTQCATQLVAALIAQLRQYDATAPPADVPAHAWAGWRAGRAVRREPLTATERSAFELCLALPYETAAMMLDHAPLLLHVAAVGYGADPGIDRLHPPGHAASDGAVAASLLHALLLNLAPRAVAEGNVKVSAALLARSAHRALPAETRTPPALVGLLSAVRPNLQPEWRSLALSWATHAADPDLALASLRAFESLNSECDARLLRHLSLCAWAALRERQCARAQLLLRLLRTLPPLAAAPLGDSTWQDLGAVAAAALSLRSEPLYLDGLRLLLFVVDNHNCVHDGEVSMTSSAPAAAAAATEALLARLAAVWSHENTHGLPPPPPPPSRRRPPSPRPRTVRAPSTSVWRRCSSRASRSRPR